jgi:membrane-associated phospholipid phosphatase
MEQGRLRRPAWREPVPQQLLPEVLRLPTAVLTAVCAAVIAALGARYAGDRQAGWLDSVVDRWVDDALHSFPALVIRLADLGNRGPVTVLTAVLVLACLVTRRWSGAVLAAVAEPAASALTEYVLKPLVGRIDRGGLSFPSGHATGMFALAGVCSVLLIDPPRHRVPGRLRLLLSLVALLVACGVSAAMIDLGWHYFTDAVAGAAVGIGVVLACTLALDLVINRARRAPASQSPPDV